MTRRRRSAGCRNASAPRGILASGGAAAFALAAFILGALVPVAGAASISGKLLLPGEPRPPMMRISLNGGEYWAYSRFDGSFVVDDVAPGTYNLDVLSAQFAFSRYKVNVRPGHASRIQALEYAYPGAQKVPVAHPLTIQPHGRLTYFVARQTYGLAQVLKNPMILMMGFTMLMVFVMPRMMKGMDPEEMEKMQEQMGSNDPNELWNELWGKKKKDGDDSDDDD